MPTVHRLPVLTCAALLLAALQLPRPALACACCSERATRIDTISDLDAATRTQLERMKFGRQAVLTSGMEDEPSGLPSGIGSTYALTVTRTDDVMTFALRTPTGIGGSLHFAIPRQVHFFTIDTFGDAKDEGLGPPLYREWRLTADVRGDGVLGGATPAGRKATLILHGRGRGCTEAEDFTDWSLILHGMLATVTFYGRLDPP